MSDESLKRSLKGQPPYTIVNLHGICQRIDIPYTVHLANFTTTTHTIPVGFFEVRLLRPCFHD